MSRAAWLLVIVVAAAVVLLGAQTVREIMDVQVLNFPDPQRVEGKLTIEGTISHGELFRLTDIIVPPVKPTDTTHLIQAGSLATNGFTSAVLSINGITKGDVLKTGTVGAYLIPEEETVFRTFVEAGRIQFPMEATVGLSPGAPYFASNPDRKTVAFPRYRVLFYNTSDKTVTVNLYAYLTH